MVSYIDHRRKGFIEYTIIPCRRLNRQVTLAVYLFYASHRFPVEHVQTPCLNSISLHGLCRGLWSMTSGLEMVKAQVWVKGFVLLHFIVTILVWTRAPRKTNNNQQTHNYFVVFLWTNPFIKNCHTLYGGKNKNSNWLKIFSWCSDDKHWHNIPGKMSLYSTYNPVYFDPWKIIRIMHFYKREMFNSNKVLMQTWSPIDGGRKGFIEYTIIPCRRLNHQITLAVYFFLRLSSFSSGTCPYTWRANNFWGFEALHCGCSVFKHPPEHFLLSTR